MTREEIAQICTDDRFRFMNRVGMKIPFTKKINLDLLVKLLIMLSRSCGKPANETCIFVDEVKNRSMIGNLHNTIDACGRPFSVMNYRNGKCKYPHVKIGIFLPVWYMLLALLAHFGLYLCLPFAGTGWVNRKSTGVLIGISQKYNRRLRGENIRVYAMTDHNFYSTVICCDERFDSYVIQHGLLLDETYYYPVYAKHFLAWGSRSKALLHNDPKAMVVGTYKFAGLERRTGKPDARKKLLYCVSITDMDLVAKKIRALRRVVGGDCTLMVKMHPGSLYSNERLEEEFQGSGIAFYKECTISEIDFDMAVIENSTVLIDLLFLGKPFFIFDTRKGYFAEYGDLVPWCEGEEDLADALESVKSCDVDRIRGAILDRELNGDRCDIWR